MSARSYMLPPAVSLPTPYTATWSDLTNSTAVTLWYRQGKFLHIEGQVLFTGAGAAGALTFSLPGAVAGSPVIDTAALSGGTATGNPSASLLGHGNWFDAGTAWKSIWPKFVNTTTIGFWNVNQAVSGSEAANGDGYNFSIKVPIVGWS